MTDRPPHCVGTYEADDPECNGSEVDPMVCAWRDRCGAFRVHLRRSKRAGGQWVNVDGELVVEPFEFRRDCDRWVELYQVRDGRPAGEQPVAAKSVDNLLERFVEGVVGEVGRELAAGRLALPGELYLTEQATYTTLYVRTRRGTDKAIVRATPKLKAGVLDVALPVKPAVAAEALGLTARPLSSGQFRSVVVVGDNDVDEAARAVVALVRSEKIRLPARRLV